MSYLPRSSFSVSEIISIEHHSNSSYTDCSSIELTNMIFKWSLSFWLLSSQTTACLFSSRLCYILCDCFCSSFVCACCFFLLLLYLSVKETNLGISVSASFSSFHIFINLFMYSFVVFEMLPSLLCKIVEAASQFSFQAELFCGIEFWLILCHDYLDDWLFNLH